MQQFRGGGCAFSWNSAHDSCVKDHQFRNQTRKKKSRQLRFGTGVHLLY